MLPYDFFEFINMRYPEVLEDLQDKARELWGEDINLSSASTLGKYVEMIAYERSLMIEHMQNLYNSKSIANSSGQALIDNLSDWAIKPRQPTYATGQLELTVEKGATINAGTLFRGGNVNGLYEATQSLVAREDGKLYIDVIALELGDKGNARENTIKTIVNDVRGLISATNPKPFVNGQDAETDEELKERHEKSRSIRGSRRLAAIEANLLQRVDGIKSATVLENDTMEERDGIPPKAIHTIYAGGDGEEVAKIVLELKAGGIQAYGHKVYELPNEGEGENFEIGVTEATDKDIWLRVTVTVKGAVDEDKIKRAIYKRVGGYYNGKLYQGLGMGEVLYMSQLESATTCDSDNILDIKVEVSEDGETYERRNIVANPYETFNIKGVEVIEGEL